MNPNHAEIYAESQLTDLRRRSPALAREAYQDIDPVHDRLFGYTRTLGQTRCLLLINFGKESLDYALPSGLAIESRLLDNGAGATAVAGAKPVSLAPLQATVYRCI